MGKRMWPRRQRTDVVAYYSGAINSDACGICLSKIWERDFPAELQSYCMSFV